MPPTTFPSSEIIYFALETYEGKLTLSDEITVNVEDATVYTPEDHYDPPITSNCLQPKSTSVDVTLNVGENFDITDIPELSAYRGFWTD